MAACQPHRCFLFFSPVQGMTTIPLAHHLVPGCELTPGDGGGPAAGGAAAGAGPGQALGRLVRGSGPSPSPSPDLPAYLADSPVMDFRHIADRERVMKLQPGERTRWVYTRVVCKAGPQV